MSCLKNTYQEPTVMKNLVQFGHLSLNMLKKQVFYKTTYVSMSVYVTMFNL